MRSKRSRHAIAGVMAAAALTAGGSIALAYDSGTNLAIGFTDLQNQLGGSIPNGGGVTVAMMEATDGGQWRADTTNAELTGKTYLTLSPYTTGSSGHATSVAINFFGTVSSMAPQVSTVHLWQADNWLSNGLGLGTTLAPATLRKVSNHSYMGNAGSFNAEALRRLDYAINRDNAIVVVATNNGASDNTLPPIWAQSYNAIVVGLTNGNHARGLTDANGEVAGRIKPDIVAPSSFTSFATPIVSSAATLLVSKVNATPALSNGSNPEVIKSILMAGATKVTEFGLGPGAGQWDRTTTRPLDDKFGAGELNIHRSYNILAASEQTASNVANVASTGWDFNTTSGSTQRYFINLASVATEVSVMLVWNRQVEDTPPPGFTPSPITLANLDLTVRNASGFVVGSIVDQSLSTVDNVEHVFLTNLAAGQYVFEVTADTVGTEYSLAWFSAVPEPGGLGLVLIGVTGLLTRRKRVAPA